MSLARVDRAQEVSMTRPIASRSPNEALLAAAVMAVLAAPAPAQLQFQRLLGRSIPGGGNHIIVLGDVDGDGDLDAVSAPSGAGLRLYVNNGAGVFVDVTAAQAPSFTSTASVMAVDLGDVDGDGDLDVVVGATPYVSERLYLNDGSGRYSDVTAAQMPNVSAFHWTRGLSLRDLDRDGDLDIALVNGLFTAGSIEAFFNDGAGTFTVATPTPLPNGSGTVAALELGDVDGDGDEDMVLAVVGTPPVSRRNLLYLNDGSGRFTDASSRIPSHAESSSDVALGDVDGDGDLDMVFGNRQTCTSWCNYDQNRLYLNSGSGSFSDAGGRLPWDQDSTQSVALGDVDGDGDLDLLIANSTGYYPPFMNRLYLNDGGGTFIDATARMPTGLASAVAVGDVDADGDADVIFGGSGGTMLLVNLLRQVEAANLPVIGTSYTLEIYARYGATRNADLALPFVSLGPASIPVPPFGVLGIDPVEAVSLPWVTIPQPAGIASSSVLVPNDPALIGLSVYGQALLLQPPLQARLTNVTMDVVR